MKKHDEHYVPLKEAWTSTRRAFLMWYQAERQMIWSIIPESVLGALMPYVGIYLSARLLNEISGARDRNTLLLLVIITLVSELALGIGRHCLARVKNIRIQCFQEPHFYAEKILHMDFCDAESSRVQNLLSQINQNSNRGGWGLRDILWILEDLSQALMKILCAVALSVSLFFLRVPAGSPLAFLNQPLFLLGILAVMLGISLLALPLGQNVAASANVDEERARACLKKAGFGERLSSLSDGLDTCLYKEYDDNGIDISGGEAQKIAIARALYKDAPFIILDEPTAALDPVAEYEIYSHFDQLIENKTAIYISHRLSSCRFCDEIAVFDQGQLIQMGSHEDLLANADGLYHQLWHAQSQYYTDEGESVPAL